MGKTPKYVHQDGMIDLNGPEFVEIEISSNNETIWVNVAGVCRLRIQDVKGFITVNDYREKK